MTSPQLLHKLVMTPYSISTTYVYRSTQQPAGTCTTIPHCTGQQQQLIHHSMFCGWTWTPQRDHPHDQLWLVSGDWLHVARRPAHRGHGCFHNSSQVVASVDLSLANRDTYILEETFFLWFFVQALFTRFMLFLRSSHHLST